MNIHHRVDSAIIIMIVEILSITLIIPTIRMINTITELMAVCIQQLTMIISMMVLMTMHSPSKLQAIHPIIMIITVITIIINMDIMVMKGLTQGVVVRRKMAYAKVTGLGMIR